MDVERHGTRQFFQGTLQIPDISHDNIIKELEEMKREQQHDIKMVGMFYKGLQKMCAVDASIAENIR